MTTRATFCVWLVDVLMRLRRWHSARVIKWENRYIHQYEKQIDDALRGIEEAKRRRAEASARLNTNSIEP